MVVTFRPIHISEVVQLHSTVLGYTLNAKIGTWFLKKLYHTTITANNNGTGFVYIEDNKVLGFVTLCSDYEQLNASIMSSISFPEKMKLGWYFLTHFWTVPTLIKRQLFSRYIARNLPQPYPSILTLGVAEHQQGKGIGKQLMEHVKQHYAASNVRNYYLDTEISNDAALQFYQKLGFREIANVYGNVIMHVRHGAPSLAHTRS